MKSKLKVGDTVYIQGRYRAKVKALHTNGSTTCRVYEGLPVWAYMKKQYDYTYPNFLLKTKKI